MNGLYQCSERAKNRGNALSAGVGFSNVKNNIKHMLTDKTVIVEFTEKNNIGIDMKVLYRGIVIDTYLINMSTYYLVRFSTKVAGLKYVLSVLPSQIIDIEE